MNAALKSQSVNETPFFFRRGSVQLFGFLHEPVGSQVSDLAFVMSHPFGEEKLWSHRVFVSCARALAERGHTVLRFDYMGAGDSSGATPDTTLETHLADLTAAVTNLQTRAATARRIGMIGLRLGATIAALFCEQASETHFSAVHSAPLILWEPVLDGENYFQELLRSNLATQLAVYGKVQESREILIERIRAGSAVNVDGYDIANGLLESAGRKDLLPTTPKQHAGPTLILQIAATEQQKTRDDLQSLAAAYGKGEFGRSREQPFWREIKPFYARANDLQQATMRWVQQHV